MASVVLGRCQRARTGGRTEGKAKTLEGWEAGRLGGWEAGRLGGLEAGRLEGLEA
jgi:hypothetical protein